MPVRFDPNGNLTGLASGLEGISDSLPAIADEAIGSGNVRMGTRIGNLAPLLDALKTQAESSTSA